MTSRRKSVMEASRRQASTDHALRKNRDEVFAKKANVTDAVKRQIAITLRTMDENERAREARMKELEGEGWRIVSSDHGCYPNKRHHWEITDKRTGAVLAKGCSSQSEEAAWEKPPNGEKWCHIDCVYDDVRAEPELVPDLPATLADVVIAWVWEREGVARALVAREGC